MGAISFCLLGDEDTEGDWDFTSKSFDRQIISAPELYAEVLTADELAVLTPPSEPGMGPMSLSPAQFQHALDYATAIAQRHGLTLPTPESLAASIQEENERSARREREYRAAHPWVRRPAELLAVLEKVERHLRATQPDWHWVDIEDEPRFECDGDFAILYEFLRKAIAQSRLVHWEYY